MLTPRLPLARRVQTALDAQPSRIPVLLGDSGTGRTTVLRQLRERIGRPAAQYIDVDRTATTPERFLRTVVGSSPFAQGETSARGTHEAFVRTLEFLSRARSASGEPVTFLLDEFLELRTFESFPGLRRVLLDLVDGLAASPNRFVLSSRYVARTLRLLKERSSRFEVIHMPALSAEDTLDLLGGLDLAPGDGAEAEHAARMIQTLGDGRAAYIGAILDALASMKSSGTPVDPVSALVSLMSPAGVLDRRCGFIYELRLHRARGYGALKAILDILGEEEGLTLTAISQRLSRTPGSTKDYLSWLEDVDLVTVRQKRYSYADPLLRVWVRLHSRPSPPSPEDVAREIHRYALPRLPHVAEPALALATSPGNDEERKGWGIIEID